MKDIHIRRALPNDADLLSALATTTFYEAYFEMDEPANLAGYIVERFNQATVKNDLLDDNSTHFIIFDNDKALGYAKLTENSGVKCVSDKDAVELERIYILYQVSGKGLGEQLLQHCLMAAKKKGFQTIWLGVWDRNIAAQKFYAKHGFVHVGERRYQYNSETVLNFVLKKTLV